MQVRLPRRTLAIGLLILTGCASTPIEQPLVTPAHPQQLLPVLSGSFHTVQPGDTLWRIARAYGLDVNALAAANRLNGANPVSIGRRLFIPLPVESNRFLWPAQGSVRSARASRGIEIVTQPGSIVRASRSGQVALATRQLSGLGKTVILDHADGYLTIYAGLDDVLVMPGTRLRQGMPLGSVGSRALHFEIRYGTKPKNALALLPQG